jgi:hypothetical protein
MNKSQMMFKGSISLEGKVFAGILGIENHWINKPLGCLIGRVPFKY